MRVCAIVLAAGLSTRLPRFKPLLPLEGRSMVARAGALFHAAGVTDVYAVTGRRAEEVAAEARANAMTPVFNDRYESGMFSSVLAGLNALPDCADAVFVLPVDIPLVRPSTVRALIERAEPAITHATLLEPMFRGEAGHPPLLLAPAIARAKTWPGEGGLAGALNGLPRLGVPVADAQILFDVDDDTAYGEACRRAGQAGVPTVEEALALLDIHHAGERGHGHGRGVAIAALSIARTLNAAGYALDLRLVETAALLHDVAKGKRLHEEAGAAILRAEGFPLLADIVAAHRDIAPQDAPRITEREVVYLADKVVRGSQRVSLRQRFEEKLAIFADDAQACGAIRRRLCNALDMARRIEEAAGLPLPQILS
jgi:CTP:molybdopterin cytidylyltransferase MocA